MKVKSEKNEACLNGMVGGAVASWLVRSTPERAVRVRTLAKEIVQDTWLLGNLTLTVPLSTQVYKWAKHPIQGGVEILLVASCYRNHKLRPDERLGSYADFERDSGKFTKMTLLYVLRAEQGR